MALCFQEYLRKSARFMITAHSLCPNCLASRTCSQCNLFIYTTPYEKNIPEEKEFLFSRNIAHPKNNDDFFFFISFVVLEYILDDKMRKVPPI